MDDKLKNITLNEGTNIDSNEENILAEQIKKIDNDICDEEFICWVNAAKILKRSNQFFWPAIILPIVSLKDKKYKTILEEFYKKPGYVVIQLLGYLKRPNMFCVSANHVFHIRLEKHNPMDYYSERIETTFQYEMTYFHIAILLLQATINHIKYDFEDEDSGNNNNNNNNNTDPFPIDTELSEIFTQMEESTDDEEVIIDETEITTIIDNNDSPSDSGIEEEKDREESEEEKEKEKEKEKKKLHIEKNKKKEKVVEKAVEEDDITTSDDEEEEFSLKHVIPNKTKLKKVENSIKNNRIRMKNKENGKNNNKSNNNNNKSKIGNMNKSGNVISNKPFKASPPSRNQISLIPKSKATPQSQPKTVDREIQSQQQQQQQQPKINKENDDNNNNKDKSKENKDDEVTHEVIYADDDDDDDDDIINSLPLPPSPTPVSNGIDESDNNNNNSDDNDDDDDDSSSSSNDLAPDPDSSTLLTSSPISLPLPPDIHSITTIQTNTIRPINSNNKSPNTNQQTTPISEKPLPQKRKLPSSLSLPPQPSLLSSSSNTSNTSNTSKIQTDDSPIEHQLIYTDSIENEDNINNKISEVDNDIPLPPLLPQKNKEISNKSILIQPTLTQNYSNKFDSLNRNNNVQKQSKTGNELRPIPNQPLVQPPPPPKEKITKSPSSLPTPPPIAPSSSSLPNKIAFRKNLPSTRQFTGIAIPKNKITPKPLQPKLVKQSQQQSPKQPVKQPVKQSQPQLVKNTVKQIPILPSRLPLPLHKQNILSSRLTINKENNTISKPINNNNNNNNNNGDIDINDDITIKRVSPLSSSSNNSPFRRVTPSPKTLSTTQMYKKVTPLPPSAISSNNNKRNSISLDTIDNSSKMVKQSGKTMLVKRKDTNNLNRESEENPTKRQKIQESQHNIITLKPPITPLLDTSNAFSPVNNNNNNNNSQIEFSGLPPSATFSPTVSTSSLPSSPLKQSSNHLPNQQNSSSLLHDLQEIDNNNIINSNTHSPLFAAFDLSPTIQPYNNNNSNNNNNNTNNNNNDNILDNILDNQDSISSSSPSPQQQSHTSTLLDYKDVQNPFISNNNNNNNNHLSTQFQDIVLSTSNNQSNDKQQQLHHPSFSPNKQIINNNPNSVDIMPLVNQSKSPILPVTQSSTSSSPATQTRKPVNLLKSIMQKQSQKNQSLSSSSSSTPTTTSQPSPIQPAKLSPPLTSQLVSNISSPPLPAMSPPQRAIPSPPSTTSQLNLDDYNNNDIELSYEASDSEINSNNNNNNNNNNSSIKQVDSTDFDFVNTDLLSPPFSPTPNIIKSVSDNSSIQSQYTSFSPVITQPKNITSTINSNNSSKLEDLELPPTKKSKVDYYSPIVDINNLKKNDKVYFRTNNGEVEGEGEISSFNGSRGIMIRTLDNKYIQLKKNDSIGIDKNSLHDVSNFILT